MTQSKDIIQQNRIPAETETNDMQYGSSIIPFSNTICGFVCHWLSGACCQDINLAVGTIAVAVAVVDKWPLVGVNLLYPQGDPQQKKVKVHIK